MKHTHTHMCTTKFVFADASDVQKPFIASFFSRLFGSHSKHIRVYRTQFVESSIYTNTIDNRDLLPVANYRTIPDMYLASKRKPSKSPRVNSLRKSRIRSRAVASHQNSRIAVPLIYENNVYVCVFVFEFAHVFFHCGYLIFIFISHLCRIILRLTQNKKTKVCASKIYLYGFCVVFAWRMFERQIQNSLCAEHTDCCRPEL